MEVYKLTRQKEQPLKVKLFVTILAFAWSAPSLGLEKSLINQAISNVNSGLYTGIDSILIYENSKLVSEYYFNYFDKEQLHQTRSTFKSIVGLLAVIAFDKKILSPDERIQPLISRYLMIDNTDFRKTQIRVKDLLNMTSGLDCSEMPGTGPYHDEVVDDGPEPLKYSLSIAMATEPGKEWKYCNANSFLLGVTISAALDRAQQPNINDFTRTNLFNPLGISEYRIYQSPDGFLYAQGNARFKPRDLAKFGLLVHRC